MKKIIAILAATIAVIACGSSKKVTNNINNVSVPITWENITSSDSAFEAFKLSEAPVQHDILRSLLTEAEDRIYNVKNQDDLQVFKHKIETIQRYYRASKRESVPIETRIKDLLVRISKVEE